jgi:hypothetical protein
MVVGQKMQIIQSAHNMEHAKQGAPNKKKKKSDVPGRLRARSG